MAEEFVDIAEASRRLGISPGELSQLVTEGKLSTVEVEGIPKFRVADLETFKTSQTEQGEEEELVLMPEGEVKAQEPEGAIPPMAAEEVTEVVEEPTAAPVTPVADESLFEGEGLLEVEEPALPKTETEAEVAPEIAEAQEEAETAAPLRETYAVPRRGNPAMTVMLLISLLLIVISGIVVMNFIKFHTTGGAPQGILEWLTAKIGGLAG